MRRHEAFTELVNVLEKGSMRDCLGVPFFALIKPMGIRYLAFVNEPKSKVGASSEVLSTNARGMVRAQESRKANALDNIELAGYIFLFVGGVVNS